MTTILQNPNELLPPNGEFAWPTAPVEARRLVQYLRACEERGVRYALGAKAARLQAWPPDYDHIDCSGWVRAALAWASAGRLIIPDGSVNQREWCETHGLKRSAYGSLTLEDEIVRIAFIRPGVVHRVGHVYLAFDGRTMESWGGRGPGSRSPLTHVLHAFTTDVFVLAVPQ